LHLKNTDVKKIIEQANYTNQYLNTIGNQLDKIEEKIDNKLLPKEKHKPFKQEKPIIKFPELKSGTSLKVNKNKSSIEKIEEMLKDLVKTKQEQPSSSNTVSVAKIPESSENSSET
jgi:CRISPR/Cas system CSM-associated protein Csm2 small subunit